MNAVNLIPAESRKQRVSVSTSPQTLGLLGGLVLVLVGVVLYVTAANKVSSRKSELAQVSAGVAQWTAAGNSYAGFVQTASQRAQQLDQVRQLANSRFPWSELLGQIGGLMPRDAALSTFAASAAPATAAASPAPTPAATSTTATTTTTGAAATSTPPVAATTAATVPVVQLTGCAASQSAVAQTMTQLHEVRDVTDVELASSTESDTTGSGAASSNTAGCPFPVQFQVSLTFGSSSSSAGSGTTATGTTGTAAAASTPSTTTSTPSTTTSTPAASASAASAPVSSTGSSTQ